MMEKTCATCRFWVPTRVNKEFRGGGEDPTFGYCRPAGTDFCRTQAVPCWPASAIAWDRYGWGQTGGKLTTLASFGCNAWREYGSDGEG